MGRISGLNFLKLFRGSVSAVLAASMIFTPVAGAVNDPSAGFAILKDISVKGETVSIETDQAVPYNVFAVSSPDRLVVELTNTENDWKKKELEVKKGSLISKVRSGQFQNDPVKIARVVIELTGPAEYEASQEEGVIRLSVRSAAGTDGNSARSEPEAVAFAPTPREAMGAAEESEPAAAVAAAPPERTAAVEEKAAAAKAKPAPPTSAKTPSKAARDREPAAAPPERTAAPEPDGAPQAAKPARSVNPSSLFGTQPVTLDFYDINIKDLFKILSEKSGVNVVYSPQISGTISIQLRDVSFTEAVDTILALSDLKLVEMGKNIVQLMTIPEFDKYKTSAISVTRIFPINYAKATDVSTQLGSILQTLGAKGKTQVDERTNSLIVTDTPEGIETVLKLIEDLDKPAPQVMIEAKIVQVQLGTSLDLGITWGIAYTDQTGNQMVTIGAAGSQSSPDPAPGSGSVGLQNRTALNPSGGSGLELGGSGFSATQGLGLTFGFVKDVVRLNAALSALEQKNKSKVLSNPKIATLNNQSASIKSEVSEPYLTTETQLTNAGTLSTQVVNQAKSGITLTVTPTINADGRITLKILPDITSSQPTSIGVPQTTSQQANTTVIVRDGETFVIGGLISELETDRKQQVPILGSIPLLGRLFKKTANAKTRAELLVFVTPKIIPY